jgi:hypothetical protein
MRRRDTLKCICYDGTGFWFVQKRLVGYKFPWPEGVEEAKGLAGEDFLLLLQGVDFFHKFEKWDSIKIS